MHHKILQKSLSDIERLEVSYQEFLEECSISDSSHSTDETDLKPSIVELETAIKSTEIENDEKPPVLEIQDQKKYNMIATLSLIFISLIMVSSIYVMIYLLPSRMNFLSLSHLQFNKILASKNINIYSIANSFRTGSEPLEPEKNLILLDIPGTNAYDVLHELSKCFSVGDTILSNRAFTNFDPKVSFHVIVFSPMYVYSFFQKYYRRPKLHRWIRFAGFHKSCKTKRHGRFY